MEGSSLWQRNIKETHQYSRDLTLGEDLALKPL